MRASLQSISSGFDLALNISRTVKNKGGRAVFVGGWVRDRLLGYSSKDIDLEIYGIPPNQLLELLETIGKVDTVGESFTVYKIGSIDVALPRRESKTGRGHRGFAVSGDPNMDFSDAARRRDFTINSIAWDPLTDAYEDPFNGRADLSSQLLRAVDLDTFGDDSLRVLRALQFSARFGLRIDNSTRELCRGIDLSDLPAERIWGEFEKLLLQSSRPSVGFSLALELGVIEKIFPELGALVGCPQEPEWHPEGDVWTHNLLVIDQARTRVDDLIRAQKITIMLGAVCHDFGKPATTAYIDGRIRSRNHEEAGVGPTECFLDRLNLHSLDGYDVRSQVIGLVLNHLKPGMWHQAREGVGDGAFRRLARKVDLELLGRLAKSDCLGRTGKFNCSAMDWFLSRAHDLGVEHAAPSPLLLGRHLLVMGLSPGPHIGSILSKVYEKQLDGEIKTLEEAKQAAGHIIEED